MATSKSTSVSNQASTSSAKSDASKSSNSKSVANSRKDYPQFGFEPIQHVYHESFFNQMVPAINEIVEKYFQSVPGELVTNWTDAHNKLLKANKDYKKAYSPIKHFFIKFAMPFAFLLFIYPGILLLRKSKELEKTKEKCLQTIDEEEGNVLRYNRAIDLIVQPNQIYKDVCREQIKYYDMGPINNSFISVMQDHWQVPQGQLPSMLSNSQTFNTLNTSWGFFNNNIVINAAKKTHYIGMHTYTGSRTVPYTHRDSNGNLQTGYQTVTASYRHPIPKYSTSSSIYAFSERSPDLSFNYAGCYTGKIFHKKPKNKDYNAFENPDFEKHYDIKRNDEVAIRTVFTPFVQEEFLKLSGGKEVPPQWKISKSGMFYTNQFETFINHNDIAWENEGPVAKFFNDPYYVMTDFEKDLKAATVAKAKNRFDSIAFMTMLPNLQSEDQTDIANEILKDQFFKKNIDSGDVCETFYILNSLYGQKKLINQGILKKIDSDVMQYIPSADSMFKVNLDGDNMLTGALINNYTYKAYPKVTYIPVYASLAHRTVDVPVNYYDYRKAEHSVPMLYAKVPQNIYFNNLFENNLDEASNNAFKTMMEEYMDTIHEDSFMVRNGIFAVFLKEANVTAETLKQSVKGFSKVVRFLSNEASIISNPVENVLKLAMGASLLMKHAEKTPEQIQAAETPSNPSQDQSDQTPLQPTNDDDLIISNEGLSEADVDVDDDTDDGVSETPIVDEDVNEEDDYNEDVDDDTFLQYAITLLNASQFDEIFLDFFKTCSRVNLSFKDFTYSGKGANTIQVENYFTKMVESVINGKK